MIVRVALIGCGPWGENLLRALSASPRAAVVAVADPDPARLARARAVSPRALLVPSIDEALAAGVDAAVIATPPASHAELALRALDAGADVLVEKPLALDLAAAERCAARAAALGRVAMVGHLLRYHPAVVRTIALAREGALGDVLGFGATRLSVDAAGDASRSIARSTLWALGPHDVSILGAIDSGAIRDIAARTRPGRVTLEARLASGLTARIELGRSSPMKVRQLRLLGTSRVALLDDVRAPDRILIAGRRGGIEREIRVRFQEPLALEVDHFLRCVEARAQPLTSLEEGALVVRVLARADAALALAPRTSPGEPGRPRLMGP